MGSQISVPLGAFVLAYNDTGVTKTFGDQVYGDKLKTSYVPGSYPEDFLSSSQLFECRGFSPATTTTDLFGNTTKAGTTTLWVRIA